MPTPSPITDRSDLETQLRSLIPSGKEPQPYTKGVLGMNSLLNSCGVPLPSGFGAVVKHNVTMVETGQISSVTAHLNEVAPLTQSAADHFKAGNYTQSAICLSGALGNLIVAPMLAGSAQKIAMDLGKRAPKSNQQAPSVVSGDTIPRPSIPSALQASTNSEKQAAKFNPKLAETLRSSKVTLNRNGTQQVPSRAPGTSKGHGGVGG